MFILSLGFLVGIVIGSFIDCIANRSVTQESFWGRSYCLACKKELKWYDLFPLISFISLKGKCRYCHKKIPSEVFLLEIFFGLLSALFFYINLPANFFVLDYLNIGLIFANLIFQIFTAGVLTAIFITDVKTGLIPDRITYPSIVISLAYTVFLIIYKIYYSYYSLMLSPLGKYLLPPKSDYFLRHSLIAINPELNSFLASLIIGGFFLALILVTRGRGMGGGDMKLGFFIGLAFGIPNAFLVIALAFLTGSAFGIFLLVTKIKRFGQTIPFGPFLTLGGLLTLLWGEKILNWYLNLKLN